MIGSKGGGVAIALTSDAEQKTTVIAFDPINIDLKENVVLLDQHLKHFLRCLGRRLSCKKRSWQCRQQCYLVKVYKTPVSES